MSVSVIFFERSFTPSQRFILITVRILLIPHESGSIELSCSTAGCHMQSRFQFLHRLAFVGCYVESDLQSSHCTLFRWLHEHNGFCHGAIIEARASTAQLYNLRLGYPFSTVRCDTVLIILLINTPLCTD